MLVVDYNSILIVTGGGTMLAVQLSMRVASRVGDMHRAFLSLRRTRGDAALP